MTKRGHSKKNDCTRLVPPDIILPLAQLRLHFLLAAIWAHLKEIGWFLKKIQSELWGEFSFMIQIRLSFHSVPYAPRNITWSQNHDIYLAQPWLVSVLLLFLLFWSYFVWLSFVSCIVTCLHVANDTRMCPCGAHQVTPSRPLRPMV